MFKGIQGELGHPEKMNLSTPKIIEGLKNEVCSDIACGSITSFAITASGKVYNWYVFIYNIIFSLSDRY
jgi:alpha-tubulin suppressor-like RCC1 family protein